MKPHNLSRKPIRTAIHTDNSGNKMYIDHYGDYAIIKIKLKSESRMRNIGLLNIKTRNLELHRERDKHLFYKMNGYGFNHHLLKEGTLFDNVLLKDEFGEWLIPKSYILENGKFLHFQKGGGFELQIFLAISEFKQFILQPSI